MNKHRCRIQEGNQCDTGPVMLMSLKANWEANTYNQTGVPRHLSFVDWNFGIPAIQSFLIVVRKMAIG
jgi:hypothetical protein